MSDSKANGIASGADFRMLAKFDDHFEPPEPVTLPGSRLTVMLRRPHAVAFSLVRYGLPSAVADGLMGLDVPAEAPAEEEKRQENARFWIDMLCAIFVKPQLSLTPGFNDVHPDLLGATDVKFLIRWAKGEVASDGSDLVAFRRQRGGREDAPDRDPDGGALQPAAERDPGAADGPLPN